MNVPTFTYTLHFPDCEYDACNFFTWLCENVGNYPCDNHTHYFMIDVSLNDKHLKMKSNIEAIFLDFLIDKFKEEHDGSIEIV